MENALLRRVTEGFDLIFFRQYFTQLKGGASEPEYRPAHGYQPACIFFREDYISSALHEVAHWCLAGEARRKLVDYGYWYAPDGRDAHQQAAFEQVEIKPQALEWLFSETLGHAFHFSADNLNSSTGVSEHFKQRVLTQKNLWLCGGLPLRARMFGSVLKEIYQGEI